MSIAHLVDVVYHAICIWTVVEKNKISHVLLIALIFLQGSLMMISNIIKYSNYTLVASADGRSLIPINMKVNHLPMNETKY